ncbi:hypothetical protein HK103_002381 [Boothiomyces macroporosus]|uniref:Tubulin-specific chaperone D n=1 Tax=Boothiomyces macroporosus TaxID=261099 RepID=A0AAD5U9F9_9FUNG|nr:hypothetical protein HK103_002381 [Boothiomyces macroporosus]
MITDKENHVTLIEQYMEAEMQKRTCINTDFVEREEFLALLQRLLNNKPIEGMQFHKFLYILDKYQERPQLLDKSLEEILSPIVEKCLHTVMKFEDSMEVSPEVDQEIRYLLPLYKVVNHLSKVRGHKTIVKFLSHQVSQLEPTLDFLSYISSKLEYSKVWEMTFVTLLWVSLICRIPFDLKKIDSGHIENGVQVPLVERVVGLVKKYLVVPGKEYEGAYILAMRLLTRKDVSVTHLASFVKWQAEQIANSESTFELRGHLRCLSALFKHGPRDILRSCVSGIMPHLELNSSIIRQNGLLRKYAAKLLQRIALCSLNVKIAVWRYQRGPRILAENLTAAVIEPTKEEQQDEEDFEITDEVEDILGTLMSNLRDTDTIVRWTAAKGIGRICNRIPKEMADEVISSILEMMQEDVYVEDRDIKRSNISSASDAVWQGCCLSLAELSRRGLLLPERLLEVVPWVLRALMFEQRKGNHSLGSNVRDSACYVCWSFARAYEPSIIQPFALELAQTLLVVALTDREISVRRAASAAFQENAGRHGLFPHGITIIQKADYFSLGNRNSCYQELIPELAVHPEYRWSIIEFLVLHCIGHWDKTIREAASASLGELAKLFPENYFITDIIPELLGNIASDELSTIHGSLLALGEVYAGTRVSQKQNITSDIELEIASCLSKLNPDSLETFGSETVREAACKFVCSIAKTGLFKELERNDYESGIWDLLTTSLTRIEEVLHTVASDAIEQFMESVEMDKEMLAQFLENAAKSKDKNVRRGYCLALGHFPYQSLIKDIQSIVTTLTGVVIDPIKDANAFNDAESRRNAVASLISILEKIKPWLQEGNHPEIFKQIYTAFQIGMEDYTIDSRGDVGSWIRDGSMKGIEMVFKFAKLACFKIEETDRIQMTQLLVLSCLEKIDRIRETAGNVFVRLLDDAQVEIPERKYLMHAIYGNSKTCDVNWLYSKEAYPAMCKCLHIPVFRDYVIIGIVNNVGGLTETLVKASTSSFSDFLNELPLQFHPDLPETTAQDIVASIDSVFAKNMNDSRISIPLLDTLDLYLSSGFHYAISEPTPLKDIFNNLKKVVFKSKNVKKLTSGIKV